MYCYMAVELDEVDVKLLTALQADADRTNVELARFAGLSPAATLHRVRWLKESGVIRIISAQLDPAAAGFPLQMYVTATLARHDPRSSRVFEDQIRALPQIIAADNVAGEMDYLLTVVAHDVTELQQVLASLAARGGQRLVTYLRLAEVKPPSRLPLTATTVPPAHPPRKRRRSTIRRPQPTAAQQTISGHQRPPAPALKAPRRLPVPGPPRSDQVSAHETRSGRCGVAGGPAPPRPSTARTPAVASGRPGASRDRGSRSVLWWITDERRGRRGGRAGAPPCPVPRTASPATTACGLSSPARRKGAASRQGVLVA